MSFTKYYKYKEKVSYDGGVTWEYTGREAASGNPIGTYDTMDECVGIKYRWVQTESTVCVKQEGGGDYLTFQLMERHGDPDLRYSASYENSRGITINIPFEYSVDSGATWNIGTNNVNLLSGLSFNVGNIIMFREDLRPYYEDKIQSGYNSVSPGHFRVLNGYWKVFGHISSMVFGTDKHLYNTIIGNYIAYGMFGIGYAGDADASNGIYDASELELVSASTYPMNMSGMYAGMFKNNKSLRVAPELPAVLKPGSYCYRGMFAGCINLTQPPSSIPVAVLESACFAGMFSGCTSLTTVPQFPSKFNVRDSRITLSFAGDPAMIIWNGGWFDEMFAGCAALRSFPQTIRLEENGKTEVIQGDTYYAGGIGLYCTFSGCTLLSGSISYRIDNYYDRDTDAYEYSADKMLEQCGGVTSVNLSIGRLVEYGEGDCSDAFGFKYMVRNTPSSGTLNLSFPSEAYTIMNGCDSPSCGIVPNGWIVNKT